MDATEIAKARAREQPWPDGAASRASRRERDSATSTARQSRARACRRAHSTSLLAPWASSAGITRPRQHADDAAAAATASRSRRGSAGFEHSPGADHANGSSSMTVPHTSAASTSTVKTGRNCSSPSRGEGGSLGLGASLSQARPVN